MDLGPSPKTRVPEPRILCSWFLSGTPVLADATHGAQEHGRHGTLCIVIVPLSFSHSPTNMETEKHQDVSGRRLLTDM